MALCGPLWAANEFIIEPDHETARPDPIPSQIIRTPSLNIHYQIQDVAPEDLARVELWYARGYKGLWQLYDYDEDRTSPIRFIAPEEGIFRFFVVAVDRWGRRSKPFSQSDTPLRTAAIPLDVPGQQVVFIDYTAPQLYLYGPRNQIERYTDRNIMIRWAGFDSHLESECVQLFYKQVDKENWTQISPVLPSIGEFNWIIPENLDSPIVIKAVITDRAGNWYCETSGTINLQNPSHQDASRNSENFLSQPAVALDGTFAIPEVPPSHSASGFNEEKAAGCFRRGNLHSQRQEWKEACYAYQEALDYNPELIEARINLSNVLYRMGDYELAQHNYETCLQGNPDRMSALFGLAQTQIALEQHDKARQTLQKILQINPKDWQAWLMLGDVYQQLNQEQNAKASWQLAARGDLPNIAKIALDRLHQRLE